MVERHLGGAGVSKVFRQRLSYDDKAVAPLVTALGDLERAVTASNAGLDLENVLARVYRSQGAGGVFGLAEHVVNTFDSISDQLEGFLGAGNATGNGHCDIQAFKKAFAGSYLHTVQPMAVEIVRDAQLVGDALWRLWQRTRQGLANSAGDPARNGEVAGAVATVGAIARFQWSPESGVAERLRAASRRHAATWQAVEIHCRDKITSW